MTKEEVDKLYKIWMFHRSRWECDCPDHHTSRKIVCEREMAWRNYVKARDEFLGPEKKKDREVDIEGLLDIFDGMGEN